MRVELFDYDEGKRLEEPAHKLPEDVKKLLRYLRVKQLKDLTAKTAEDLINTQHCSMRLLGKVKGMLQDDGLKLKGE